MTDFLFYVILNDSEESHRITDRHILLTLVVGYFAYAQYDVFFIPYRLAALRLQSTSPEGGSKLLSLRA